jgi:sugar phosphate isomerase/epimerase
MFREIANRHMGSNFDIGHATVEGAYGDWQITARALASHIRMVAVKDFVWRGDRPRWVPLGEGVVNLPGFFEVLRSVNYAGPISMHFEYSTRSHEEMAQHIDNAAKLVRNSLAEAGYA